MNTRATRKIQTPRSDECTVATTALLVDAVAIAPKYQRMFGVSKRGSRSSEAGGWRRSLVTRRMMASGPDGAAPRRGERAGERVGLARVARARGADTAVPRPSRRCVDSREDDPDADLEPR